LTFPTHVEQGISLHGAGNFSSLHGIENFPGLWLDHFLDHFFDPNVIILGASIDLAHNFRLKVFRPAPAAMIYAQNLYRFTVRSVRNDIRRLRNHEFTSTRHATGTSDMWIVGQQVFDIVKDAKDNSPCAGRTFFGDVGSQRG
jgi:hypothetical protein